MPEAPSFMPRALLEHPDDFGVEAEATWCFAHNLDGPSASAVPSTSTPRLWAWNVSSAGVGTQSPTWLVSSESVRRPSPPSTGRRPAPEANLWVYDLRTNKHFTLKQKPLTRANLDDFVACYQPADRTKRVESERFKRFGYDEIMARDKVNLDITWLKDDSDVDAADLPDPDLLIAEIVEELTAAAAELAAAASLPEGD